MEEKIYSTEWLGRTLTIKTGKLARQATSAVTVQYGDTVVLATVVESKEEREGIDFFPLQVDFEERLYAAGMIKGSRWIKREGRPSDEAILTGRMIDRSIRPLFSDQSRKETQISIMVLSVDQVNDYDIVALVAASAALAISGVDWKGPIGGIRVGRMENNLIFNPTYAEREKCDMEIIVAGTEKRVLMIESGANEATEDDVLSAIISGMEQYTPVVDLIVKMKNEAPIKERVLKEKEKISEEDQRVLDMAENWLNKNVKNILFDKIYYTKGERKAAVEAIKEQLKAYLGSEGVGQDKKTMAVSKKVEPIVEAEVTRAILQDKRRVDGRALDQIRKLYAEPSLLPRNHGSGLFSRGETQVLSIVTLGSPGMAQSLEGIEGVGTKRYMHHYYFPPYSVGEAKGLKQPGRREIGHGALAEKALIPVLPSKEEFPYTVRVVSEVLSSNGSSSMGSTCGSSLALMDAGVPIKKPVAGVAMGLASVEDMSQWEILTDIQDLEDGKGGMDFKITGTADGITAIQLDTKTIGLDKEIMEKTFAQSKKARLEILEVMNKAIDKPRPDLSPYAPRIISFYINPDKIREVIGSGGKVINKIIEETGVTIDIEDDGLVVICGIDKEKCDQATTQVQNIAREFQAGEIFTGKVVRMLDFGAFVELMPGRDGMVHVSELAPYRVEKPSDFLEIGDVVTVKIKEIDDQGRVNLTMKGLPENEPLWKDEKGKSQGGGFGGPRFDRNGGGGRGRFNDRGPRRPSRFGR